MHAAGLSAPDPRQPDELVEMDLGQTVDATRKLQNSVGQRQDARAGHPVPDQDGDELVVAERGDPALLELLSRSIVGRQVIHLCKVRETACYTPNGMRRRLFPAIAFAIAGLACSG